MPGVRVVTDSACDLSDEQLAELGIGLVPLRIRFGAEELVDREQLSTKEFWSRCAGFDGLPETSAPSPGQFQQVFEAMAGEGADGVVCISLSSKMSATIEAARQAARSVEGSLPVKVVDSLNVTLGLGLIVVDAAQRAAGGATLEDVAAAAGATARSTKLYGVIDTLENIRRGGRIGGAQALLGSVLSIKPVVEVRDGVVEEESKQRTRGKALHYLAAKVMAAGPISRLAVFDAMAPDMDDFLKLIDDVKPSGGVVRGDIGPAIGTHAGPRCIGVAWTAL
ncbi:MAG: DegV family protein [Acidimicrobiales bacterium]